MLGVVMLTQLAGVIIFSGKAQAIGTATYQATITQGYNNEALDRPTAVAVALDGSYYIASAGTNKIHKYNASGAAIDEIGGASGSGDGQFNGPYSLAVDRQGYLYVYDGYNTRIQKFDSSGAFVAKWGSSGSGDGQFQSVNMTYIAAAPNGNIYVSDAGNNRVQVFSNTGTFLYKWGTYGDGAGQLNNPEGIAIDSLGNAWVCDSDNYRIQKFTYNGTHLQTLAGYTCDNIAINKKGELYLTSEGTITFNSGQINKITKISSDGNLVAQWGNYGSGNGEHDFYLEEFGLNASGIAINADGKVYVADVGNQRVQVYQDNSFDLRIATLPATVINQDNARLNLQTSDYLGTVAATYGFEYGTTTSYGSTASSSGRQPTQLAATPFTGGTTIQYSGWNQAMDRHGNFYINPYGSLRKYNSSGQYIGQIGPPYYFYGGNYTSMAFDSQDNVYYSEYSGGEGSGINKYAADGSSLGTIGSGLNGYNRLATDLADNLYVLTSSQVRKFSPTGTLLNTFTLPETTNLLCGGNIVVDSQGNIYVIDALDCGVGGSVGGTMRKFSADWQLLDEWSATPTFNLYIDVNDVIYTNGQVLYDNSGNSITPSQGVVQGFVGIDNVTGKAYGIHDDVPSLVSYTSQGYANIGDLQCGETYHYRATATFGGETVYGADQQFTTVACDPMQIGTTSLPDGQIDVEYSEQINTNSSDPAITVTDGSLPPGLTMDETGAITGTPTTYGTYAFTIEAVDNSSNNAGSDSQELQIYIAGDGSSLEITTESLPDGRTGFAYSASIEAVNVLGSVEYSIASGSNLPPGLSLNSSTGEITGVPADMGTTNFNVGFVATDAERSVTRYLSLLVTQVNSIYICDADLNDTLRLNRQYSDTICTSAGFGYKTFSVVSGSLPPGITLNAITGEVSGSATTVGSYSAVIQVSDITGNDQIEYNLNVIPDPEPRSNTPIITITSPSPGTSFNYQQDTVVVSGTGPASQTITVYMDGQLLGTTTSSSSGAWQYTVSKVFPGSHTFDAKWIPPSDLIVMPSVSYDFLSGGESLVASVGLLDAQTMKNIKTLHLNEEALIISSTINNAGTKAYVLGLALSGYSAVWEIDLASGSVKRVQELMFEGTVFAAIEISDDDKTAVVVAPGGEDRYVVASINLTDYSSAGDPIFVPVYMDQEGVEDILSLSNSVLLQGSMYSPISSIEADTDDRTVTAVNVTDGALSHITVLDEPRWEDCNTVVDTDGSSVYFFANDTLSIVNPTTKAVTRTITIDGLSGDQPCAVDMVIDAKHNKAFILLEDGVHVVDLINETVTVIGVIPTPLLKSALVAGFTQYFIDNPQIAEFLRENSGGEFNIDDLDGFVDQIVEELLNSDDEEDMILLSLFYGADLGSDGDRIYLTTPLMGMTVAIDTSTLEYVAAGGPVSFFGYNIYLGGGNFADQSVPASASTSFSVGLGPVILPPTDPLTPPEEPIITNVTPSSPPTARTKTTPIKAPQSAVSTQNSLFALAKRIPEPFAIGFPWFLLGLALTLVGIQYYQVRSESLSTKRMQASVAHQKELVEEQNNFVALSTHYLHTPLTVMEGEISLMVKAGTLTQAQASKLKATLASLNAEAEAALQQEEQGE